MIANLRVSIFLSLVSFPFAPFGLAAQEAKRPIDPSLVIEQFDVPSDGDVLTVPVAFGKKPYLFVLDTGCSVTVYDHSFKPELGNVQSLEQMDGPNGMAWTEMFHSPEAHLGKLSLKTQELVSCDDLGPIRRVTGLEVYGIIGMDFLRRHVVHLDSDTGKLSFLRTVPQDPGTAVLITYDGDVPSIVAKLEVWARNASWWTREQLASASALRSDVSHAVLCRERRDG